MKINTNYLPEVVCLPAVSAVKPGNIKAPAVTEQAKASFLAEIIFADKGFRLPEGTVTVAKKTTRVYGKAIGNCERGQEYGEGAGCWNQGYPPHGWIKDSLEDTHCWDADISSGWGKKMFVVRNKHKAKHCHWFYDDK